MGNRKRIFMCALAQESNSFNPVYMPLSRFYVHSVGVSGYEDDRGARDYLASQNAECIYGVCMRSNSGGPLTDETVEFFLRDTTEKIRAAGKLDGVLLMLHGATLSQTCMDVCGRIAETVRELVGENTVIVGAFDLHGIVTERIVKHMDYLCGYWEYPHVDRYHTGKRAAKLLWDALCGRSMKMARAAVPSIAPASSYTTHSAALKRINEKGAALMASGRIIDYSVFQAQPWCDSPLLESAVVVVADTEQTAIDVANELATDSFCARQELQGKAPLSVEEVIQKALNNQSGKPIILVDSSDSIGAGSTGDSAAVIEALLPYSERIMAAVDVRDAQAVEKAFEVGVGNTAEFTLGGTMAPTLSKPVTLTAKVKSLHDGVFYSHGPLVKGKQVWSGKTAVLETGKLLIRVSVLGDGVFDVNYYRSMGIPIELCDLVSVKACASFKASYEAFADEFCQTNTPGAACPSLLSLPFQNLPKPTYPFEEITESDIKHAKLYR